MKVDWDDMNVVQEIKYGSLIHKDGTVNKTTRIRFDSEEEMWLYYDNVLPEPKNVLLDVHTNSILLEDEFVPMQEYRDYLAYTNPNFQNKGEEE